MNAVLADDLSGAAELAGLALRFGLKTEIKNSFSGSTDADLLVLNTASRVINANHAYQRVQKATKFLLAFNPGWIFKKTDSVLRGNVLAELKAICDITGLQKCLLIPANPSMNRTIIKQIYMVEKRELINTSFADDPDYPCHSSNALQLLGTFRDIKTGYLIADQEIEAPGVFIGETKDEKSLKVWASRVNTDVLPAGAADFFRVFLNKKNYKHTELKYDTTADYGKTLFVCGSTHKYSRQAIQQAGQKGAVILYMPEKLIFDLNKDALKQWFQQIDKAFKKTDKIILAVDAENVGSKEAARRIQGAFSQVIRMLIPHIALNTLVIEGGETAQEITGALKINNFYPGSLLAPGVVELETKLKHPSTCILKPGSYPWPASLWWS